MRLGHPAHDGIRLTDDGELTIATSESASAMAFARELVAADRLAERRLRRERDRVAVVGAREVRDADLPRVAQVHRRAVHVGEARGDLDRADRRGRAQRLRPTRATAPQNAKAGLPSRSHKGCSSKPAVAGTPTEFSVTYELTVAGR